MPSQPPSVISEEAKEAFFLEVQVVKAKENAIGDIDIPQPGYFVQLAIDQATSKLREEVEQLKTSLQLATYGKYGSVDYAMQCNDFQSQLTQAREELANWKMCSECEHNDKIKITDELQQTREELKRLRTI